MTLTPHGGMTTRKRATVTKGAFPSSCRCPLVLGVHGRPSCSLPSPLLLASLNWVCRYYDEIRVYNADEEMPPNTWVMLRDPESELLYYYHTGMWMFGEGAELVCMCVLG